MRERRFDYMSKKFLLLLPAAALLASCGGGASSSNPSTGGEGSSDPSSSITSEEKGSEQDLSDSEVIDGVADHLSKSVVNAYNSLVAKGVNLDLHVGAKDVLFYQAIAKGEAMDINDSKTNRISVPNASIDLGASIGVEGDASEGIKANMLKAALSLNVSGSAALRGEKSTYDEEAEDYVTEPVNIDLNINNAGLNAYLKEGSVYADLSDGSLLKAVKDNVSILDLVGVSPLDPSGELSDADVIQNMYDSMGLAKFKLVDVLKEDTFVIPPLSVVEEGINSIKPYINLGLVAFGDYFKLTTDSKGNNDLAFLLNKETLPHFVVMVNQMMGAEVEEGYEAEIAEQIGKTINDIALELHVKFSNENVFSGISLALDMDAIVSQSISANKDVRTIDYQNNLKGSFAASFDFSYGEMKHVIPEIDPEEYTNLSGLFGIGGGEEVVEGDPIAIED